MTRYSVYALRPDRRFVTGTDNYTRAKALAAEVVSRWGAEVWDNRRGQPAYSIRGGGRESEATWAGPAPRRPAGGPVRTDERHEYEQSEHQEGICGWCGQGERVGTHF